MGVVAGISEIGEFSRMETETGAESDRPRDDEIQAFHNQIRAADAEKLEFVGEKVGLSSVGLLECGLQAELCNFFCWWIRRWNEE